MEDTLEDYPKIHTLGSPDNKNIFEEIIVCESKIDGANFRCRYIPEEDRFVFGSHHSILKEPNPNHWKAVRSYQKAKELYKDKLIPNVIYFSESMQVHTFTYDNVPDTVGYDIFDLTTQEFYNWRDAKIAFENIGIPFIHVHFEKHGSEVTIEELKTLIKTSAYRKGSEEGIVLKCYTKKNVFGRPLTAKLVDDFFKEENRKVFNGSNNPPIPKDIEYEIIDRYLTDARFRKAIFHFKDQEEEINMSLIPKVYKYLGDDILSENILYISGEWKALNFKTFYSLVANRCAMKMKIYLEENI